MKANQMKIEGNRASNECLKVEETFDFALKNLKTNSDSIVPI